MANHIFQIKAELIKNIKITERYYKIILNCSSIAKIAKPGQFLQVKISDSCEPFLRRPFSIHHAKGVNIEIFYEILGKGTEILSQRKPGGYLDIIGPLGNGFDYKSHVTRHTSQVLVAGGMGVAPLLFLAEKLRERNTQYAIRNTQVLIGAKTKGQILCEKEFKKLGCDVKMSTDDGSRGFKGKVTELLRDILAQGSGFKAQGKSFTPAPCALRPAPVIYACGPRPMLKEISRISKEYNIPAQVSLEEHLACGIGACLGCVVKTKEGFKRVCKEGPVFAADEVIW